MVEELIGGLLLVVCFAALFVCLFWYAHCSAVKENERLHRELRDLKIVNKNLAKYNEFLLDKLKK